MKETALQKAANRVRKIEACIEARLGVIDRLEAQGRNFEAEKLLADLGDMQEELRLARQAFFAEQRKATGH